MTSVRIHHTLQSALLLVLGCAGAALQAQTPPTVFPSQRATAERVAQAGVPLAELADNAPASHTVKSGDTLWAIAGLFLKSPWNWPQLWGMNLQDIANPHRIYPGQVLWLDKSGGRAILRVRSDDSGVPPTDAVRLSPRTRIGALADNAIPTLEPHLIEPFLAEPLVVQEAALQSAPRIVAAQEGRVMLSRGDRAYARGGLVLEPQKPDLWRVFRSATPLKDPGTGEILGYQAHYVGQARLVRSESTRAATDGDKNSIEIIPATIDIVASKEEMRPGDRLLPEPPQEYLSYAPSAPQQTMQGRVVSLYGNAVGFAGQNQVITLNKGSRDGLQRGHVLALLKDGAAMIDTTNGQRTPIKLPDERNGLVMVFLTFERVSYALVLQLTDGVKVGDRFTNP